MTPAGGWSAGHDRSVPPSMSRCRTPLRNRCMPPPRLSKSESPPSLATWLARTCWNLLKLNQNQHHETSTKLRFASPTFNTAASMQPSSHENTIATGFGKCPIWIHLGVERTSRKHTVVGGGSPIWMVDVQIHHYATPYCRSWIACLGCSGMVTWLWVILVCIYLYMYTYMYIYVNTCLHRFFAWLDYSHPHMSTMMSFSRAFLRCSRSCGKSLGRCSCRGFSSDQAFKKKALS